MRLYILIVLTGIIACYSLLNAGNPESLMRYIFPDSKNDIYIAFFFSFLVFVLGFFIFYFNDKKDFLHLVELNKEKIKKLRKEGQKEEEIADSLLNAIGIIKKGYRYNLARKKLIFYISKV